MIFHETKLPGVYVIELEPKVDERGSFARTYCQKEFAERGLCTEWVQTSTSFNRRRGTLRGMHYQIAPCEEIKLVRCTRGAVYDVALDLRPESPAYCQWFATTLSADNGRMFYLPKGVAHGFQTQEETTEVFYMISEFYSPQASVGVRWNDPAFSIDWFTEERLLSPRDAGFADYERRAQF